MSEHYFLVYFPESPEVETAVLAFKDSYYAGLALRHSAAEFGLKVQKDMRLIAVSRHRR